jgi:hypothetical protein
VPAPKTGGVTAIQRFGGALNLNLHLHSVLPDGVFDLSGSGPPRFIPLAARSDEEVDGILRRTIRRSAKLVAACDASPEDREDALAELQATEVDRGRRLAIQLPHQRHSATLDGFSLHAGVHIHANDREGREKLFRYILRPPLSLQRLSMGEDGRLRYQMKRNGALVLSLTPDELLAKPATLVPQPRVHCLRYHGLFALHAKWRSRVVPSAPPAAEAHAHAPSAVSLASPLVESSGVSAAASGARPALSNERKYRIPWAEMLQKVFAIDVLACPVCHGRMKLIAYINSASVARRILEHLGLPATGPPLAKARFPDSDG